MGAGKAELNGIPATSRLIVLQSGNPAGPEILRSPLNLIFPNGCYATSHNQNDERETTKWSAEFIPPGEA
jgi:hypothetical protein